MRIVWVLVTSTPIYLLPAIGIVVAGWVGLVVGLVLLVALLGSVARPVELEVWLVDAVGASTDQTGQRAQS